VIGANPPAPDPDIRRERAGRGTEAQRGEKRRREAGYPGRVLF